MIRRRYIALCLASALVLGGLVATAHAATSAPFVDACYNTQNGQLRVRIGSSACKNNESPISWPSQAGSSSGVSGDVIPLLTLGNSSGQNYINIAGGTDYAPASVVDGGVLVDASMYPVGAVVRVGYYGELRPPSEPGGPIETCLRLYDVTAGAAVLGSELCASSPPFNGEDEPLIAFDLTSSPLSLASSPHRYIIQWKNSSAGGKGAVRSAELTLRW